MFFQLKFQTSCTVEASPLVQLWFTASRKLAFGDSDLVGFFFHLGFLLDLPSQPNRKEEANRTGNFLPTSAVMVDDQCCVLSDV